MEEIDKLKQLLEKLLIDYEQIGKSTIEVKTKKVLINECSDGLYMFGWGYSGIWPYTAEYIAKILDKKFIEEMEEARNVTECQGLDGAEVRKINSNQTAAEGV